jgi:restriction endonuclease S subunit
MKRKLKLKDIAEVQTGYQFRGKVEPDPTGTHKVIQIRDFDDGLNLKVAGLYAVTPKGDATRYAVSRGDVLFLSRGHRNYALPIKDSLQNTIVASYFFILRIKTKNVLPEYLAWYINQAPVQEYLHIMARQGTHMPLIPLSAFSDLEVELPGIETQKIIIKIGRLLEKEKELMGELQEKRLAIIKTICLKATKKKEKRG